MIIPFDSLGKQVNHLLLLGIREFLPYSEQADGLPYLAAGLGIELGRRQRYPCL